MTVVPDGPLWVTGGIPVERADGQPMETRNRVTLCRCGASGNKPLCDGSHKEVGFSELQFNILAPIPGLMIAGAPATQCDPYVVPDCTAIRDVEIIKQFKEPAA